MQVPENEKVQEPQIKYNLCDITSLNLSMKNFSNSKCLD